MANIIKILSEKSIPSNSTTFLLASFNRESTRFKIVAENHNCDWNVDIYIQTKNYDFAKIACKYDIPGVNPVSYVASEENRINGNENNIKAAIEFIEKVF
jgi:hypothetical protein